MKKKGLIALILIFALTISTASAFGTVSTSKYTGTAYNHNDKFSNSLLVDGVDVSAWQGTIDWNQVKADGVDFAIIRVGGRGYGAAGKMYYDDYYRKNIENAKKAGLMIGIYYFSQAVTEAEAVEEAKHALALLGQYDIELPIFMDYEYASDSQNPGRLNTAKLSKSQATANVEAFCRTIENAGYDAGIYANLNFLNHSIDGRALGQKYFVWAAQYYNKCEFEHTYGIWQYSSKGKVKGINTNADCNFWYLDKNPKASQSKSIANCRVEVDDAPYKANSNHEPGVKVTYNGTLLKEGKDYKVGYINNRSIGTAYAYVIGIGEFADHQAVPFEISESLGIDDSIDITSSKYSFGTYVTGVTLKTSMEEFKSDITLGEGYTYKICNASGTEVNTGNVGTGMKLVVYDRDNKTVGNAVIVAKGDADGNGECTLSELVKIRKHIMDISVAQGSTFKGLDVNASGTVDLADLISVRKHIMGIKEIKG